MPRATRRIRKPSYALTEEFADALVQFKDASGLSWAEIARQLGTSTLNLWRWRRGTYPNSHHLLALQDLAGSLGLAHLLPRARVRTF